ncbi:MAG TPA: 3-dehydroquinate synthase [Bacteroidia bacterium]|nr:3-dehydroquinate synthase [Bacteroidia bacterium]
MQVINQSSTSEIILGEDVFSALAQFLSRQYRNYSVFILVDETTERLCLPLMIRNIPSLQQATVLRVRSGELNKSLQSCEDIWNQLTQNNADRHSLLINLGGGMIGDLGGFVASTYMRGISFVNIPTTLLAMVDASSGGKNGVNLSGLKNQIGTFTHPIAVGISPVFLKTLPARDIRAGFAELIKHSLIADPGHWQEIKKIKSLDSVDWNPLIAASVQIKKQIVAADFKEKNLRKTLNFGHTIGHALESYSMQHDADPLKHGEAVAAGMVGELFLSNRIIGFPEARMEEIVDFIVSHFRLSALNAEINQILSLISHDKKSVGKDTQFVLLKDIGSPVIHQQPEEQDIQDALKFTLDRFHLTPYSS